MNEHPLTADEAKSLALRATTTENLVKTVLEAVYEAACRGEQRVTIPVKLSSAAVDRLSALGYNATFSGTFEDGPRSLITWDRPGYRNPRS